MQRDRYRDRSRGRGRDRRLTSVCLLLPVKVWWPGLPWGPETWRVLLACLHDGSVRAAQRWHTAARVRKGKISREPVWYGTVVAVQSVPRVMLISLPGSAPTATVPRLVAGG